MVVSFNRTIDVDCQGLPEEVLFSEAVGLLLGFFDRESDHRVAAVQACPGRVARVTFAENGDAAKLFFEELGVIKLGDVECRVVKPPPPPPQLTTVVVSWFPFEGSNDAISTALSAYGTVKSVRNQVWPGRPSVSTGSRIVQMVIRNVIPPFIPIRGVRCKTWYRGQPLQCGTCRKVGHKSADCPLKGKCFRCHQDGHLARNCKVTVAAPAEADAPVTENGVAVPPVKSTPAEEETPDTAIEDSEDEVGSPPDSDASEDRFASCETTGNENIISATEGFANPADSDMAGESGPWTTVSRKRPASSVPVSVKRTQQAPSKSPVVSPMSDIRNGPDVFLEVPELAACSADHRAILWEIAVDYRKPPDQRKRFCRWTSDPRFIGLKDEDFKTAIKFFNKKFPK
ncbi:uncharacterized protein LOC111345018 [Stylophora pistillata]|nr:uncharacterized protein LOC111345018 [Stylophora pistillata]